MNIYLTLGCYWQNHIFRVSGSTISGKDVDGDGIPDIPLRYEMDDSDAVVQFPVGFCPNAKGGINFNCSGNFGVVLKEWETITRVRCYMTMTFYHPWLFFIIIHVLYPLDIPWKF